MRWPFGRQDRAGGTSREHSTPFVDRHEVEKIRYSVSEVAAKYSASVAAETSNRDDAYADWPQGFEPMRLPWPPA